MFDNENSLKDVFLASLIGLCASLLLSLVLIPILSLVLSLMPDPAHFIFPIGIAILFISSFAGGVFAKIKGEKLLAPIISGSMLTAIVLIVSMLLGKITALSPAVAVLAFAAIPSFSTLGGLSCSLRSSRRQSRNKRRRRR